MNLSSFGRTIAAATVAGTLALGAGSAFAQTATKPDSTKPPAAAAATSSKPETVDQIYQKLMFVQSLDGRFDAKAMATMPRAIVDLGILDQEPDLKPLHTEAFLPQM